MRLLNLRAEEALAEARQIKDHGQPFLGVPLLVKGLATPIKGMPNLMVSPSSQPKAGRDSPFVKPL